MTSSNRGKNTEAARGRGDKVRNRRDESWDERLRLTGDARFIDVEWSGRDHPNWPLPTA
jgi:hypothetical protein